ncbi:MAG: hypothetical protein H7A39_06755 [Chlamydiales bacterium]|nr:hypothetical protein [Chlamydiales bacterium]
MPVAIECRTHINEQLFAQMYWNQIVREAVLAAAVAGGRVQTSHQIVYRGNTEITIRMMRVIFLPQGKGGLDFSIGR